MDNLLVTVIIPVYNVQEYLDDCIRSIVEQTYQNLEILLVDNGSEDESRKICCNWAERDKRIKVLNSKKGVSSARNFALSHANGKYIYFVDSDDWIEKDLIEYAITSFEPSYLLIFGYYLENHGAKKKVKKIYTENMSLNGDKYAIANLFRQGLLGSVWNKMYDADVIKDRELLFHEELSLGEDIIFNLDYLAAINGNVKTLNECKYHYIRRDIQSLDHKFYADFSDIQKRIYQQFLGYIDQPIGNPAFQLINFLFFNALVVGIDNIYQYRKELDRKEYLDMLSDRIHDPDVKKIIDNMIGIRRVGCYIRWSGIQIGFFPIDFHARNIVKKLMRLK